MTKAITRAAYLPAESLGIARAIGSTDPIVRPGRAGPRPPELRRWYIDRALEEDTHVMLFERDGRKVVSSVTADNEKAARALVHHLADRGHQRIAFIASKVAWPQVEERYAGYRRALTALGLVHDPRLEVFEGAWTAENGVAIARRRLTLPRPPTAIMGGNDLLAIGVLHAARELGLSVPEELAITGFNDFSFSAYTNPGLTTASIPGYEMGLKAADDLIDMLEQSEPTPPRHRVLPITLQLRGSA